MKILIVGPAWIGDMVMAQTLFIELHRLYPDAIIDVLAPDWTRPLLARMPQIRQAISMPIGHGQLKLRTRYHIAQSLKHENYDHAIVLPNSFKSALIPWLANIPKRTGWRGEMRYGLLNDIRILDKARYPLMIERFIALAYAPKYALPDPLPHPLLQTAEDEIENALTTFELTLDKPVLALCPGAEFGPAKRWPAKYFAEIAKEKHAQGWQIWLFGSAKEQVITNEIQQACGNVCVDLAGHTTLAQAIDLLSVAKLAVTNDSGLMHIAAALQRPLVVIYGSSSAGFTPPLSTNVKILNLALECSPCFKRECPLEHMNCLNNLLPQQVLQAMSELVVSP